MGSGCFPLPRSDELSVKLLQAAELIQEVLTEGYSGVYSGEWGGMQVDNAAADGAYLGKLQLAQQLILEQVEKKK